MRLISLMILSMITTGCSIPKMNPDIADGSPDFYTNTWRVPVFVEPGLNLNTLEAIGYIDSKLDKYCECIEQEFNTPCTKWKIRTIGLIIMDGWKMNTPVGIRAGYYQTVGNLVLIAWGGRYIIPHEYDHALGYLESGHSNLEERRRCYFE